jgi:hypothetical protein
MSSQRNQLTSKEPHPSLIGCVRLPGLLGNGLRIRRDLDLSRSQISGAHRTSASTSRSSAIWLCESEIGGRLLCVDTVIDGQGQRAIQADRIRTGGAVRLLHQFTSRGEITLIGAHIGGSVDLTGAHIVSSDGPAVDLEDADVEGGVFLIEGPSGRRPEIRGRLDMGSARVIGRFLVRNAILEARTDVSAGSIYASPSVIGKAINAARLSVGAEVVFEGRCEVAGTIDLSRGQTSSLSISGNCMLRAPGRTALDLTSAEIGADLTVHPGAVVQGSIRLTGAHIRGNLSLQGTQLSAPERSSLVSAHTATVDGYVELRDLRASGGRLRFGSGTLGNVVAVRAQLDNPGGFTLDLHQARVKGSVVLGDGFRSAGLVTLSRSTISGRLEFAGGSFSCPAPFERNQGGHAIEAVSATITGGIELGGASISPSIDFTNAITTFLADDPQSWPPQFIISGFTYDRFEQPRAVTSGPIWDQAARISWLSRQKTYDSSPYEQAARVFRAHGYASEAEDILIAQRRRARQTMTGRTAASRRALNVLYDATVRYGYRPGRALRFLAALLILVTTSLEVPAWQATLRATTAAGITYTTRGALNTAAITSLRQTPDIDACGNGQVHCFSPVFYAIDTVLPLISLDQRSTWYPDPSARYGSFTQWWLNIATLLGWLLSSIFVLSLARLARTT